MVPLNPELPDQPVLPSSWNRFDTAGGSVTEVSLRARSLKLAFETRSSSKQDDVGQFLKVVNGMPVPALLLTQSGKIITVNREARNLMSRLGVSLPWHHEPRLWKVLGWPAVPFRQWDWHGALLSAWDYPLDHSSDRSKLRIRYVKEEIPRDRDQSLQQDRMAVLGQEVMRVVHDMRQPLTSLEWFATLLGGDQQSVHERQDLVAHLVRAVRTLDDMLGSLLTFAKPVQVDRQRMSISGLLDEVEWLVVHPLRQKRIIIRRSVEPGLDEVWGDEPLLKRAVFNVVLNAIQASSPGGHIEIACQSVALGDSSQPSVSANRAVQFAVRDVGCGIPLKDMGKIFDPFFSKRKGGTGLGLAIVKHILNVHHGLIDLQSEHGMGTTVRLVLPQ